MNLTNDRIRCLLLEDEMPTRHMMMDIMAGKFPNIAVKACSNLKDADQIFETEEIDMLILDIHLPDGNSFAWLASKLEEQLITLKIVFVTAYSDFAIEAFRFNAMDFLLKPFSPNDLVRSIDKVLSRIDDEWRRIEMELALQNMTQQANADKKLVLRTVDDIHVVQLQEILYASSDNNYTYFYLASGRQLLVSQPLKSFELKLSGVGFMRVHQSYLVNLDHIQTFKRRTSVLVLSNNTEIAVAQSKKHVLVEYFSKLS